MNREQKLLSFTLTPGKEFYFLLLGCLVLAFFFPLFSLILIILIISLLFLTRWNYSVIESILLSLLAVFVATITLYTFITIMSWQLAVGFAYFCVLVASLATLTYAVLKKRVLVVKSPLMKQGDIPALLASLATFVFLLIPLWGKTSAEIAQFLSYGEDNASHYALVKYDVHHGAFSYTQDPEASGVITTLTTYPQGFHINAAVFSSIIHPLRFSEEKLLKLYAVFIALNYTVFIFWLTKLCFSFTRKNHLFISFAVVAGIFLLCNSGVFISLLDRGFQAQVFAYSFLMAIIFIMNTDAVSRKRTVKSALLAAALCVGIATSWWLILLPLSIAVLVYLWDKGFWKKVRQDFLKVLALLISVFTVITYPILVNFFLSNKSDPLNEQGGVDKLEWILFLYLGIGIAVSLPLLIKNIQKYSFIMLGLITSLAFAGGVGFYQQATNGQLEYFFYKSLYTVFVFMAILFFIGVIELASFAHKRLGRFHSLVAICLLSVCVIASFITQLIPLRVYANNWYAHVTQLSDFKYLFSPTTNQYGDVLFVGSCQPGRDYLNNRWSGARLLSEGTLHSQVELAGLYGRQEELSKRLHKLAGSDKPLLLIEHTECSDKIPDLPSIKALPNVTTIPSL